MRLLAAAVALAVTMGLIAPSLAATVQAARGQVLVNTGTGYRPVRSGTSVNPGAIVVVGAGGSAQVVYPDGCVVPVGAGGNPVHSVLQVSPCQGGGADYTYYLVPGLAVAGVTTAIIVLSQDDDDNPVSP